MRLALAAAALILSACSSTSTTESGPVTENAVMDGRRRAEVHTALAGEYYQRGNYVVALAETRAALKDDSTFVGAYNMQALVFMELKEDAQAREAFAKALSLSPNNPEVLNNYGWFLCLRNDPTRGVELMRRASQDNMYPTPEKAYLSIGLCMRRLGRNNEAEDALRRAVMIRPDLIGALYNLAQITYERGQMADAENYLIRFMRLTPQPSMEALIMGVRIARARNDSITEQSYIQQLRRRFPDAPETQELLEKRN